MWQTWRGALQNPLQGRTCPRCWECCQLLPSFPQLHRAPCPRTHPSQGSPNLGTVIEVSGLAFGELSGTNVMVCAHSGLAMGWAEVLLDLLCSSALPSTQACFPPLLSTGLDSYNTLCAQLHPKTTAHDTRIGTTALPAQSAV